MKTVSFEHSLSDTEIRFLQNLIGKDLCGIGSDSISIQPSKPDIWNFHKWLEVSNWNDNSVLQLNYSFDETYSSDDFIELRIEEIQRERKALNADLSFAGHDKFTIQKIETYGYDSEYTVKNNCGDLPKNDLKEHEKYFEIMQSENVILMYSTHNKRIIIECQFPYLQLTVTMNEDYINSRLNLSKPEFKAKMTLKHNIQ